MNLIRTLTGNHIINICFISWFFAQTIKTAIDWLINKSFSRERLIGSGGMPSSHSAMVSSLSIAMARSEGFTSSIFALTLAFSAVVIYDAMGVRRAAGEQAKALNRMQYKYNNFFDFLTEHFSLQFGGEDERASMSNSSLKEFLGHTPLEVLAGSLLGILVAMIYPA
jgi:acid phosphatase family membrane protein YuiD